MALSDSADDKNRLSKRIAFLSSAQFSNAQNFIIEFDADDLTLTLCDVATESGWTIKLKMLPELLAALSLFDHTAHLAGMLE